MKRPLAKAGASNLLAIITVILAALLHANAATVSFTNNRLSASLLPYGGMVPILDVRVTSDGERDEAVTGFDFATIGGVAKTPVNVDLYVYENTVPGSLGRFVGKANFKAGAQVSIDVFLDFYQGLVDLRELTVYAASRDTVNAGIVIGIQPLRMRGSGDTFVVQDERSMMLTLNSNLKIGVVKWQSTDDNIVAAAQHQNQLLGTFDITVENERVTFTDLPMRVDYYGKVDGIRRVTLQDEFGTKIAGPADVEDDGSGRGGYCFFSGPFTLSRGTHTVQVRGNPGAADYGASIMCSIDARLDAEQVVTLKGETYSYWLNPERPTLYMQSVKLATPTFRYTVRGAQGAVVSPGKRVLLGYIILNEDDDEDTRFENIEFRSVRLKFSQPVRGLLDNMSLRFDWALSATTTDFSFISNDEVQLNFVNRSIMGRLTKNNRLLVEADVAEVSQVSEVTAHVEPSTFSAVGADYAVPANAVSVDSTAFTVKIGPLTDSSVGGHIQWINRVAQTNGTDYYEMDVATVEAGQYQIEMAYGFDQPWTNIVMYVGKSGSVAKVTTPAIVQKPIMMFRVRRSP